MHTITTITVLISLILHAQTGLSQGMIQSMKNSHDWKHNLDTFSAAFGELPSKQTRQHFWGRYLITLVASAGIWTFGVATVSLIDNGTANVPRGWFEDNALRIARPSVVLSSSTISMLLYKRHQLNAFVATTTLSSALLLGGHLAGKLMSEEADVLLQLTTTFFLVPLTSTLYHHILSSKEESGVKIGKVEFDLPVLSVQRVNKKVLPVLSVHLKW